MHDWLAHLNGDTAAHLIEAVFAALATIGTGLSWLVHEVQSQSRRARTARDDELAELKRQHELDIAALAKQKADDAATIARLRARIERYRIDELP